ncbi:MAG: acetate--CoA ligase family protein [Bacillota bacterium]|nr:acetate--CoA ligase family protein [Bacillota bacterium]
MSKLSSFFAPAAVAVVGASNTPGKVGHSLVRNLQESGYPGKILPINPKEKEILGYRCFPDIAAVGEPVDLAVISIPAVHVLQAARECGAAGVKHLIVISAGFKETGTEGLKLERELVGICQEHGMNLLGPNCLGMMDMHTPLNASFAGTFPVKGEIAFVSQSGAICTAILDWSLERGIGFSKFISLGNKAGLNEADFIEDAASDPYTKVILCYIESVADGRRFIRVARSAARKKPIIIFKSGISEAGARAASSHTGALAGNDRTYQTVFEQCGLLRVHSLEELFALATVFTTQPLPKGDRVAILTNAGGPGIIAADNIETRGLTMARFEKETIEALRSKLPAEANVYDPVDVIGDARADRYAFALEKIMADPNVDSAVVLLTPQAMTEPEGTAEAIIKAKENHKDKPLVASFMGGPAVRKGADLLEAAGIPCYAFPEPAIASLASMVKYASFRRAPLPQPEPPRQFDRRTVEQVFARVRGEGRKVLMGSEAAEVAAAFGVSVAPLGLATSHAEAARLAEEYGFPVVLKVASPKIMHKTDIGGVRLNLSSSEEVRQAFAQIMENVRRYLPQVTPHGVEVQKMMPKGRELIIGMNRDLIFGPMIMFGMGGIYVNLLKDVSFRLAENLTRAEAHAMIKETKAYVLLRGFRGEPPADLEAVVDALLGIARLCVEFPEISELDVNPLFAYEKGVAALDVKITIS